MALRMEDSTSVLQKDLMAGITTEYKYADTITIIKQKTIMSVIPTKEYMLIKEVIKDIDNKAFVIVCDSYEVKGQDVSINDVNKTKK